MSAMWRVVLAISLLAFSGYVWPVLYKRSTTVGALLIYMAGGLVAVMVLLLLALKINRMHPSSVRSRFSIRRSAALLVACLPVALLQAALAVAYWGWGGNSQMRLGALEKLPFAVLLLWAVVDASIRGIAEESVFRGLLQPSLARRFASHSYGAVRAIGWTTVSFVLVHIYGVWHLALLPYFAILSVAYGHLTAKTGSMMGAMALHVMHNINAILIVYFGIFRLGAGAGFISVAALTVASFVAIDALARYWNKGASRLAAPAGQLG